MTCLQIQQVRPDHTENLLLLAAIKFACGDFAAALDYNRRVAPQAAPAKAHFAQVSLLSQQCLTSHPPCNINSSLQTREAFVLTSLDWSPAAKCIRSRSWTCCCPRFPLSLSLSGSVLHAYMCNVTVRTGTHSLLALCFARTCNNRTGAHYFLCAHCPFFLSASPLPFCVSRVMPTWLLSCCSRTTAKRPSKPFATPWRLTRCDERGRRGDAPRREIAQTTKCAQKVATFASFSHMALSRRVLSTWPPLHDYCSLSLLLLFCSLSILLSLYMYLFLSLV